MKRKCIFNNINIDRFSTFNSFNIKNLGLINLIVGRNNVGKTQLLKYIKSISLENTIYIDKGINKNKLVEIFKSSWIKISNKEKGYLLNIFQQIDPEISDILLDDKKDIRIILLNKQQIPLQYLSNGIMSFIKIYFAIHSLEDTCILIDEIETGIHVSIYDELFELIANLADRRCIQFFITTHSIDIIESFLNIWQKRGDNFCSFKRLYKKDGHTHSNEYFKDELESAIYENIDVR